MRTNNINSVTVLFVAPNFKEEAHLYVEKSSQERQEAVFFFLFFKNSIVLLTEECSRNVQEANCTGNRFNTDATTGCCKFIFSILMWLHFTTAVPLGINFGSPKPKTCLTAGLKKLMSICFHLFKQTKQNKTCTTSPHTTVIPQSQAITVC